MNWIQGPFVSAVLFVLASAALHIFAFLAGGFSSEAFGLIPFGLVYLVLAGLLAVGWRIFGYLGFVVMIFAGIVAMGFMWADHPVAWWWFGLTMVADWLAALNLFLVLWRDPVRKAEA